MKINVEFNSLADMANFTKFINDSLVPPTQKQVSTSALQKELAKAVEQAAHYKGINGMLEDRLDRAYARIRMADPKGETANKEEPVPKEAKDFNDFMDILTVRSSNCLRAENIDSFKKLCGMTANELLKIPNLGRGSLKEIVQELKAYKRNLKK
jgi:DNA-directed RNA polymerase alpha subunit